MARRRVLVLFAHPALQRSRVNSRLLAAPRELPDVHLHDLYEMYPRLDIDVRREQELLLAHDVFVCQHPFYWYSTPSIVKEWQDLVLEHGWAYGAQGTALRGKRWLQVVTTGGREEAYCAQGSNRLTVRQLLAPLEQTARLCGMEFLPPFVVHGTHAMDDEAIARHVRDYREVLEALQEDRVDIAAVSASPRLNVDLKRALRPREKA